MNFSRLLESRTEHMTCKAMIYSNSNVVAEGHM